MATGLLTTGNITVTVSGRIRNMHVKEHMAKIAIASGLYPTSGIKLPQTKESYGFSFKFTNLTLVDTDDNSAHVLKLDHDLNRLHVFKTKLVSGTGQSLVETAVNSGVPALTIWVRARGY